jgi:hypothetical protein
MTLKEKFKQWLDTQPREQIREVQLEVIAEDFAIGFAQWLMKTRFKSIENIPVEKLLEIYKKQKGL